MAGRCLNNLISIFVNRFIILEKCTVFADETLKIKIHRTNHLTPKIDFFQSMLCTTVNRYILHSKTFKVPGPCHRGLVNSLRTFQSPLKSTDNYLESTKSHLEFF